MDHHSRESRKFRLRFRVPYVLFMRLLAWTRTWREYSPDNPTGVREMDACGSPRAPTELLLLGVLH